MKDGRTRPKDPFADIHEVSDTIDRYLAFLGSRAPLVGEPPLSDDARRSILEFVNSRKPA